MEPRFPQSGTSFLEILQDPLTQKLLGFNAVYAEKTPFISGVTSRLAFLLHDATKHPFFLKAGYSALEAFLQANCTGPPLDFNSEQVIFPDAYRQDNVKALRQEILRSLSVDGKPVYPLTRHVELFWLAKVILSHPTFAEAWYNGIRARFRVNFWHQKLLDEHSDSLQEVIYSDAVILEHQLASRLAHDSAAAEEEVVEFLVERANVYTYYGDGEQARADLARAATTRHFQFALSGALGKRTKFQDRDVSQLVVLAKSRDHSPHFGHNSSLSAVSEPRKPENLPLNDDTLHEHIQFTQIPVHESDMTKVAEPSTLPPQLATLDPAKQPLLFPMDSIILLATASSISNMSPSDGLTREETLPYATRVLQAGPSNWQIYTQALLVRSRIEGYRARTAERGLLQLQALVDQVITETSSNQPDSKTTADGDAPPAPTTFLPKPNAAESASAAERLKYVYQLSPPLRWELEAELASRWTQMGGLKTALEIYERLEMHAEAALCLAATDREADAIKLLRSRLFDEDATTTVRQEIAKAIVPVSTAEPPPLPPTLKLHTPPPPSAPRLLCILGDITTTPAYYTLAWTISSARYGRAQRSLGKYYVKTRNFAAAAEAFKLALNTSRLDHATWFALGCVQLEREDWPSAVESFTRCVQLEDKDAQSWSNLAVALLRLPPHAGQATGQEPSSESLTTLAIDEESTHALHTQPPNPHTHTWEALRALRRAATLQRDDARIWDNYLTVAASIPPSANPPTPWNDIIQAMGRVVELRAKREGEKCIDLKILEVLVDYVTSEFDYPAETSVTETSASSTQETEKGAAEERGPVLADSSGPAENGNDHQPRLPYPARALLSLIDTQLTPLATSSATLYGLLSHVAQWRHRPADALSLMEKSWRAVTVTAISPSIYDTTPGWDRVVVATERLVSAYRELGPLQRERTGGPVEAQWRFKARSAVRSVLGRGKENWEGTQGYERLTEILDELKL